MGSPFLHDIVTAEWFRVFLCFGMTLYWLKTAFSPLYNNNNDNNNNNNNICCLLRLWTCSATSRGCRTNTVRNSTRSYDTGARRGPVSSPISQYTSYSRSVMTPCARWYLTVFKAICTCFQEKYSCFHKLFPFFWSYLALFEAIWRFLKLFSSFCSYLALLEEL